MDIVARARNIIQSPRSEWPVVAAEPTDIMGLYTGYAVILAAIPLVAELIRLLVGGAPLRVAILVPVSGYVMSLIAVALLGVISSKLAPSFGGTDNMGQAFKLATYAYTAAWLGGVFLLLPWVGWLLRLLCGIYGIYLYYLGIIELVQVPPERRAGYLIVVIVATIVVAWIIAAILVGGLIGLPLMMLH